MNFLRRAHWRVQASRVTVAVWFVVSWTQPARTQTPSQTPAPGLRPPMAIAADLVAALAGGAELPVIIGVTTARVFQAEATLTPADASTQRFNVAQAQNGVLATLAATGVTSATAFETIPFVAARIHTAALAALQSSPLVISIDEDRLSFPTLTQSVPLIQANAAWGNGYTGAGWTVAVLDDGVEHTHSFLSGKVISEACYSNAGGFGSGIAVCPGGVANTIAAGSGVPCGVDCSHGTHVAGIAAGRGASFSGVAPDSSLIAVQVFTRFPGGVGSYDADLIRGLERVYALRSTYNIAAVNMSLGGGRYFSPGACDADNAATKAVIDNLRAVGIPVVISSGNEGYSDSLSAPGCISSAVSVGSTTKSDTVSPFSNTAYFLSLLAPGSSINSSVLSGSFDFKSGTSMAAPHVAGTWAILKQARPTGSVSELLAALQGTGVGATHPLSGLTFPRINVAAALASFGCSYSVSATDILLDASVSTGMIDVTAPGECGWTAHSNTSWLSVTGGSPASGSGTTTFQAAANTSSARIGTLTVAGFTVTISQAALFTDDALAAGVTSVRAVHLTDLRTRINTLRSRYGLTPTSWTDPTLTAGVTTIRAVHLTELRTSLDDVYTHTGRAIPGYSDSTIAPRFTLIRVVHIRELRDAVAALW